MVFYRYPRWISGWMGKIVAKRKCPSHKTDRTWIRMGTNGKMKYINGTDWKGMAKSNYRLMNGRRKFEIAS